MQKKGIKSIKKYNQKKRRKVARVCGLFFVCFLLILGIVYFVLHQKVSRIPTDRACEGVWVGHVDVSGLTEEQAQKAVDKKAEEYREQTITFQAGNKSVSASLGELGFDIEKEEQLIKQAVDYGNDGSVWSRYFQIRKLKREKKIFAPEYKVEKEAAEKVLRERVSGLLEGAVNATIARENGEFVLTDEKEGTELNEKATIKAINTYLNKEWKGKAGTVKIVTRRQKPAIARKDLETIHDKLGTFSTYCGSGESRVTNIIRGAELINGTVLMPGEEFSAGQTMKPFTAENKYVEAGAYENGEVVASLAGGICQVSTTLYNAAINAELDITSRQPHSMTVHYVKPSRDAAIAGDYKDLRFKNNYDTPILIEGYITGGNVVFNIYGKETRPEGRTIEFVSETVSMEEPAKKFTEQADAQIGTIRENVSTHKSISARLWKVVYENGKEVSREIFNRSNYKSSPTKVSVGTASDNPQYTRIIRDAIRTQDEAKIKAAIADVKARKAAEAAAKQPPVQEPPEQEPPKTEEAPQEGQ